MPDFMNLRVWQAAHALTLDLYRVTSDYPKHELYGLTSQSRRAAASIPANIAEGSGRDSDADYARFVRLATGSANELEYHLLLAKDLGFVDSETWSALTNSLKSVRRRLVRLSQTLKNAAAF